MTRRFRHELLPPANFTVPTATAVGDLSFTAVNEDGTESFYVTLEKQPGAIQLRVDLIAALAELNGPRGRWRSVETVTQGSTVARRFLRWLEQEGLQPQSAADIDVAIWNAWVLRRGGEVTASGANGIRFLRTVLGCAPGRSESLVQAMGRRGRTVPAPLQDSYREDEHRRIRRHARKTMHTAARRISANYELLLRRQTGTVLRPDELAKADALLELLQTGEVSTLSAYKAANAYNRKTRMPSLRLLRQTLFLTPHEGWAAAVLLAAEAGWNRSVIERLTQPDNSVGAGDGVTVYSVILNKPRRGHRQHSTTTVLANSDVGRALTWIINATEPARAALSHAGYPTDRLLIADRWSHYSSPQTRFQIGIPNLVEAPNSWPAELHPVSLTKLRRTSQVLFDQTPTQNSRRTHQDVYLRNDKATHVAVQDVIETGLNNALAQAEAVVKMKMLAEEQVSDEIRSGKADTVIAACRDYGHNPATGTTCVESFLACLGCSNAIATPRHLTRLVVVHDALEELGGVINSDEWRERWEVHFVRLCTLLERHTTAAERQIARLAVTDADRAITNRLLSGGLSAV
jgi:hypothetical protein